MAGCQKDKWYRRSKHSWGAWKEVNKVTVDPQLESFKGNIRAYREIMDQAGIFSVLKRVCTNCGEVEGKKVKLAKI